MTSDYSEKARAIFLAAIMVLSVFAMGASFAGSSVATVSNSGTPNDLVVGSADAGTSQATTGIVVDTKGDVEINISTLQENGVDLSGASAEVTINDGSSASVTNFNTTTGIVTVDVTALDSGTNSADFNLILSGLDTSSADASASGLTYEVTDVSASDSSDSATFAFAEGGISGTVTDVDTADPIEGATVELNDEGNNAEAIATTTTDSNGDYSFDSVSGGTYNVTVTQSSYEVTTSGSTTLQDTTTEDTTLDVTPDQVALSSVTNGGDTVGDTVTATLNLDPETVDGEIEVVHNYTTETETLTGTDTDATFSAAKVDDQGVTLYVDGTPISTDTYATANYYVTADPSEVVLNSEEVVDGAVYQYYDLDSESGDLYEESIDYALVANWTSGTTEDITKETGSTSSGTFSVDGIFDTSNDWAIGVSTTASATEIKDTNNEGSATITVEDRNIVDNLTVDPANPVYNDEVTVTGTLVDTNGDVVSGNTIELRTASTGGGSLVGVDTTGSNGAFEVTGTVDDATTYYIRDTTDGADVENFDVNASDANVTVTPEGENLQGFDETYNIDVRDEAGNIITYDWETTDVTATGDNIVNVTGPFAGTDVQAGNSNADVNVAKGNLVNSVTTTTNTTYIHVSPNANGELQIEAQPLTETKEVAATLQTNDGGLVDGFENSTRTTAGTPDLTGSDAAATSESNQDLITEITQDSIEVTGPSDTDAAEDIDVDVVGSDNLKPADGNALSNATVTISAPEIGIDEQSVFLNGSNTAESSDGSTASFSVFAEQAGEVSVEITGVTDDGEEVTDSGSVEVVGDNYNNLSPTSTSIDATEELSVQVTNDEGTPVNNREVVFTHSEANGFNVTDTANSGYDEGNQLVIDATTGEVTVDGNTVEDFGSVNNGEYSASNVTFAKTGDVDFEVRNGANDDTLVNVTDAITATGIEAYEVDSDLDAALAGADEAHNLTITEDGAVVNGSALDDFTVEVSNGDKTATVNSPTAVDTNGDGTNDALQVSFLPETPSEPLNVTVDDGSDRTGTTSLDVVEPEISTTLGDDVLTLGLSKTNVEITAEDPRSTGDVLADARLQLTANNATFEIAGDLSNDELTGSDTVTLDENGTATVSIAPNASETSDGPISLGLAVDANDDGSDYFGDTSLDVGEMSIEAPDELEPNTEYDDTWVVRDANDNRIDGYDVTLSGAVESEVTETTDEGYVNFAFTTTSGTIDVDVAGDAGTATVKEITVKQQVNLSLSANATDVQVNDTVQFDLTRDDYDAATAGTLTIYNASGDMVDQISRDSPDGDLLYTFEEAGDFTVVAEKADGDSKTFMNDTVAVSVTEEAAPGEANFEVSDLEAPGTVTQGDNVTVTATIENTGDAEATQTVEYRFAGDVLAEEEVTLAGGENQTVEFTVPVDAEPGTYTHGVYTDDHQFLTEITVEAAGGNYYDDYVNADDVVTTSGLNDAVSAYLSGNLEDSEINAIISSYLSGDPIA